jgi:hypothetical protein
MLYALGARQCLRADFASYLPVRSMVVLAYMGAIEG